MVDGKLAGVASGENTQGLVYNKTLLTSNGLPEPTTGHELGGATSPGPSRSAKNDQGARHQDPSADYKAFWVWLRQQGKDLYNGKELGFTAEDVTKWFELWKGARDRAPPRPPDVIHEGNASDVTKQLVVTGKAAHLLGLGPTRCRS